jgi:PKD repeat protein
LINGATGNNTITFDGVDPLTRIVNFNGTTTTSDATIKILGTKNITIQNLGVKNMGTTYAMGIRIANNGAQMSDSITIKGCNIEVPTYAPTGSSSWIGLGITSSLTSIAALSTSEIAENITVDGNTFIGGYYGYGSYGSSTYYNNNYRIVNNTFNNQYYSSLYAYSYHEKIVIDNNTINNLGVAVNTSGFGIYTYYNSGSTITRNRICGQNAGYGLYNYYENNSRTNTSLIANNAISLGNAFNTYTTYGLYCYSPFNVTIAYNSIKNVGNNSTANAGLYTYFSSTTYNNNVIVNNSMANFGPGYAMYIGGSSNTTAQACISKMDNNNYYSNGTYPLRFVSNILTNTQLSLWSSSTFAGATNDLNTLMVDPGYLTDCNLPTISLDLDSNGTVVSGVTTDINGNTRNANFPDIGAHEFDGPTYNLKVIGISAPNAPSSAGSTEVKVVIQNAGYANITSANVNYKINASGTPITLAYSGNLSFGGIDTVTFSGSKAYTIVSGVKDSIYAFTNSPNGFQDQYLPNDTFVKCACEALNGTYTIGGSGVRNFGSFNDASTALSQCGVSNAVVINVQPGTYNEQVVFQTIPGASSTNRVTLKSATGVASDVVINWSSTSAADNYIFKLDRVEFLNIEKMSFENSGVSFATNIWFTGLGNSGSNNNIFEGNVFRGYKSATTSNNHTLVVSSTDNHEYNTFKQNTFLYGSYGIYHQGYNVIPLFSREWLIEGNTFDSVAYMSIRLSNCVKFRIKNNAITTNTSYTGVYGIYISSPNDGGEISGNKIVFDQSGTYPIYVASHNTSYFSYFSVLDTFRIHNNFISWSNNAGSYACYLSSNRDIAVVHNSFNITGGTTYALYVSTTAGYKTFFMNNSIASNNYAVFNNLPFTVSDNNNLFTTGANFASINGVTLSNIAAFKNASYTGSDANSISVTPNYISATDLHSRSEQFVSAGAPLGLTTDIDGDARNLSAPVIGADEYSADIQVVRVSGPAAVGCDRTTEKVKVMLRNVGQSIVSNINLAMQVNNGNPVNETYTGSMNPGDSAEYTFNALADLSTVGNNTILVISSRSIDYNPSNDYASLTVLHASNPVASFTHKDTCFGGTVMFTNTSSAVSGTITGYAWDFDNSNTSTATNPSQAFAGVGPYNVKLSATSSNGCVGSTTVQVNILTALMPGTIAGTQTSCYNSTPNSFTSVSSASGSGTNYNYQWQMSTNGTTFTDISGATGATYQSSGLTVNTWFRRAVTTDLGCGPVFSNEIKVTLYDEIVAGNISGVQSICYNTTPTSLYGVSNPTGGDGTFTHRWESSINGSSWFTIIGANGTSYTPSQLNTTTYFRRVDVGGSSCGEKMSNVIKVTVYDDLTAGTFSNYDICPNSSPGAISQTSGATGGDGNYTYKWQMSSDNINWSDISGANSISYTPGVLSSTTYFKREATSGSGCGSKTSSSISVDVRTLPTASFTTSNHCIGDRVPLTNTSTPGYGSLSTFFWDFGNGHTSNANTPNYTYPNGGNKTIKLVVTNNIGCKDSTIRTADVSNIPQASFNYIYNCANDSILFKNSTSINCGVINAFSWLFGDGDSSTLENPVHKYASSGTYQVTYIIYLSGGLTDTLINNITIYPKGVVDFSVSDVCYNEVSMFTNSSTNAGAYLWKFGDNNTSNATNPNHLYATSNSYQVTLQAVSLNGCNFSVTKTHVVKVRPDADIVSGNRCLGDTLPFGNGSIYAHSYNWDFGDGTSSALATPSKLYANAGTFNVKLVATNNNGCVDSTTSSATIYGLPTADFTVNNTCFGEDINFTNTSADYVSSAWNLGDGSSSATQNPVYRYANAGNYTIGLQVTSSFGCKNSTSKSVTVYPKPSISFTKSNVCSGTAANFTNTSSISSGSLSYNWNFGDGNSSTQTSPSNTYAVAGVYNVKLVGSSGFGCSDSITNSISIYTGAIADFSSSNSCLGTATNFSNLSQNASNYSWDFGDGTTSTNANPSKTYSAVGSYTVKLTANNSNNCSSVVSKTIQVNALPTVNFSGNNVCLGSATTFTNNSTGAVSYSWDFGDGSSSTSANPTRTYASAGNYTVRLVATSGSNCSAVGTRSVQVYANPIAGFNANSVCAGTSLQFVNTSSGANTYAWTFGDGNTSTNVNPLKTYATAGTYTVTLTVTSSNNCTNVISKQLLIYATPFANFSNTTECVGAATIFTNSSSGATSYNWTFGDGNASTTASPSYTYGNAGTYNVTLVAMNGNGCKNQMVKNVTVNSKPVANFAASNVCLGNAVNFSNSTTGATSYNWSFGDATTSNSASPSKTYAAAGNYTVTLTATNANNCSSVISKQVTVYANPTAGFSATEECLGKTSVFTNSSTGAVLYNWNFGDGTTSPLTNPTKAYSTAGAYMVTLTATNSNGCSNNVSKTVNAFANPIANFSSSVICTDNTTQLTNTSTGATSFSWNFGDGNTSTSTSPSKTYASAGSYVVTLTASNSNNCKSTVQNTVVVSPAPVASFSANEVCLGGVTSFNNTSTNASSASWTFGDGGVSSQLFPNHTYVSANSYTVNLSVMASNGCTSNSSKTVVVNANPTANFTASNACQGTIVNISNTSNGADSYEWYYGLVGPDKVMTPNVSLNNVGTTAIRLVAITNKGCKNETSKNIEIYNKPKADFEVLNTCAGDQTRFVNKSLSAGSYNWQFGDGNNNGNSNPSHQYSGAGSYYVTLTANNAQCSDVITKSVAVNALPSSDFVFGTSGKDVNFTSGNKVDVKSYGWNFGDGANGNLADPKHTYNNAVVTVYNVCLTVVDNKGCQSETCKPVSINLLGKEEITLNNGILVYPNPNQGSFKVKVGGSQDRADVVVYNLVGVKVANAMAIGNDHYTVNASDLSAGTYMVKVTLEGKTTVLNVVITR